MRPSLPYSTRMNRRRFLRIAAAIPAVERSAAAAGIPIIDTHIHLFDTRRPQGVPWPEKTDTILYKPALPSRYRDIAAPLGITGAVVVEASPLLEDNQWILDLALKDKIVVATVGNLEPGKPDFRKHLERFQRNPLFRGIRYGNLWGRDMGKDLARPEFIADLKFLAAAGLELDTFNPEPALITDVMRLTDKVSDLRVVINHLAQMDVPTESSALRVYRANLRELGQRPQVFVKVSAVLRRVNGRVPQDLNFYRSRLDEFWNIFGEDRLLYASDWPNSDLWAPYAALLHLVREYFGAKGEGAAEKFFWKNSVAAYRWVKRDASQPDPKS